MGTCFLRTLLSVAFLAPVAGAQEVELRVGHPLVDARRVVARTDTFVVTTSNGTAQMVVRRAALGDTALLTVERITAGSDATVDSFVVRKPTLEPLYFERHNRSENHSLVYSGRRMRGTVTSGGQTTSIDAPIAPPAFFLNSTDMLLASLSLREGAVFRARMWDTDASELRIHVAGKEMVSTLEGGRCEAWRIETEDGGGVPLIYWVEVGTQSLLAVQTDGFGFRIKRHSACRAEAG